MEPDWLGSPQHFVGGGVVAVIVVLVAARWITRWWFLAALAVSVAALLECLVELVEYPVMYSGRLHATSYYDTLADIAATLAGAVVGATLGLLVLELRGRSAARQR